MKKKERAPNNRQKKPNPRKTQKKPHSAMGVGDSTTIFTETAHIPDRDQVFSEVPSPDQPAGGILEEDKELWSGDLEDIEKGNRDTHGDTVDELAQGRQTSSLLREERLYEKQRGLKNTKTSSLPENENPVHNPYETMSKNELLMRAEALGVPRRDLMTKRELIRHIIAAREAG